jgi:hypothetical protein
MEDESQIPTFELPHEISDDGSKVDNLIHQISQLPRSTQMTEFETLLTQQQEE